MKKLAYIFVASLAVLTACQPTPTGTLAELKAKRVQVEASADSVDAILKGLDKRIAELDTGNTKRIVNITAEKVMKAPFEHYFEVQGAVEAERNSMVYPEAPGEVLSIKVKEGQRVKKGTVLARLDGAAANSGVQEVKNALELAEKVFKKQERLYKQKIGSEIDYLQAKNNYEGLKQKLKTVSSQAGMYTVRAPFDGIVDEIFPKVGEMAAPQMPVLRIVNLGQVYIKSDVSEQYLGNISKNGKVLVEFPSLGETIETSINRVGEFINPNNRTFKVRVDLPNRKGVYKPNLLATMKFRDYMSKNAVLVPPHVIQQDRQGREYVYILGSKDGEQVAKKVNIKTGMTYNNQTEVLEGLKGTEMYIDKGGRTVQDGEVVKKTN